MIDLNSKHYQKFLSCLSEEQEQKAIGRTPSKWYSDVTGGLSARLSVEPLCRTKLKEFCANSNNSDAECVASVMSWGGQRVGHGKMVFIGDKDDESRPIDAITLIVAEMRAGRITRKDAYKQFHQLRLDRKLKGMGIAYFTKLIYFCDPKHYGYILDQWLAKSVNLLLDYPLVDITRYGYVTDFNDAEKYQEFCEVIDHIAKITDKTPNQIETAMFSHGGRNKGNWRSYVIKPE